MQRLRKENPSEAFHASFFLQTQEILPIRRCV
jgi:hypothetical protein